MMLQPNCLPSTKFQPYRHSKIYFISDKKILLNAKWVITQCESALPTPKSLFKANSEPFIQCTKFSVRLIKHTFTFENSVSTTNFYVYQRIHNSRKLTLTELHKYSRRSNIACIFWLSVITYLK